MIDDVCTSRRIRTALFALCLLIPGAAGAQSAPHQRAGEWVTQMNGGRTTRACLKNDLVMDQATVLRRLSRMKGAQCTVADVHTAGASTTYTIACVVNGTMHLNGQETMTMVGPDTFQTRSAMHMDKGQIHDMTSVTTTHRTGPCQPGDANF